jgi:sugar lactone lactonase YvrE
MRRRLALLAWLAVVALACTRRNPAWRGVPSADAAVEGPADAPLVEEDAPAPDAELDAAPDAALATDAPLPTPDAAVAAADAPPPPDAAASFTCGTGRGAVEGISGADGLAIGPDGTIYFTSDDGTDGWVGRMYGTIIERQWLRIEGAPLTAGLALDRTGKALYVAGVSAQGIIRYDLGASVTGTAVVTGVTLINDVVVGPDDRVYFSRQSDRHVYAFTPPTGPAFAVTTSTIGAAAADQAPAALAFGPDGALYVGMRKGGPILRLTLDPVTRRETGRAAYGTVTGWGNGLAFDQSGRLYVALYDDELMERVVRVGPGGNEDVETNGRFASMAFGRGPLDCHDLYIAVPPGSMRRLATDTPGYFLAP